MTDYSKSHIYCIRCKDKSIIDEYVGSSVHPTSRKSNHKLNCSNPNRKDYNIPLYQFIRNNGGWNNWEFIILEKFPCNDIVELRIRERYWIELRQSTLNYDIPTRTKQEYYEENYINNKGEIYERKKAYNDNYRTENKIKINEKAKEKITCECGSIFRKSDLSKHLRTNKHITFIENLNL